MRSRFLTPSWFTVVAVLAIAFVLVGSSLIAASKSTTGGTCSDKMAVCPMQKSGDGAIVAKVVAVNSDGSLTVNVKPAAGAPEAVKQAFAKAKVGDTFNCGGMGTMRCGNGCKACCGDNCKACCGDGGCKACCGDNCKACCGDKCGDCKGCATQTTAAGCPMGKCAK
jgi:hypothetical protein